MAEFSDTISSSAPVEADGEASDSPSGLTIEVQYHDDGWRQLTDIAQAIDDAVAELEQQAVCQGYLPTNATVVLSNDAAVRSLNLQFRGRDSATNVLAFPAGPEQMQCDRADQNLGDVVLALETMLAEAARDQVLPVHHLQHLVVHGLLHLFGFDHLTDDEAEVMEALEIRVLGGLGIANPYTGDRHDEDALRACHE